MNGNNNGFNPNDNYSNGFNPNQSYNNNNNNNRQNNNSNQRPGNSRYFNFRNNNSRNNNSDDYYNSQPINNVFADDPNEALAKKTLFKGVLSLVLAFLGIVVFWVAVANDIMVCGLVVSPLITIAGFVFGIMSIISSSKYNKLSKQVEMVNSINRSKNQNGMVCAIIAVILSVISIVSCVSCVGCAGCIGYAKNKVSDYDYMSFISKDLYSDFV